MSAVKLVEKPLGELLIICNPLLDISVTVNDDFIRKHGKEPGLASLADDKDLPLFTEIQAFDSVEYMAGGAGQNTARAVAFMSPTSKVVHYIGCVGKDENAQKLRSAAEKAGVQVHYAVSEKNPTGRVAVLVSHKERTLVAHLAAANDYSHSHFESAEVQSALQRVQYVYTPSFFLTVSPQTLLAVGQHCAEHDKLYAINIAAPFLVQFFWDGKMSELLKYADFVIGNETEGAAITERLGGDPKDLRAGLKLVADYPKVNSKRPRTVIFTQNEKPVLMYCNRTYYEFPNEEVPKDKIVDMNGAGDSFVGGFLTSLIHQNKDHVNLRHAVDCGHWLASRVIQRSGCTFPETNDFKW